MLKATTTYYPRLTVDKIKAAPQRGMLQGGIKPNGEIGLSRPGKTQPRPWRVIGNKKWEEQKK
jgi:hypothetical protein